MFREIAALIPPDSPLATGWRAHAVRWLEQHGIGEMLDLLAAYTELRCRLEPDDCGLAAEAEAGSWARLSEPAQRRIAANEPPRGPGAPRQDGTLPAVQKRLPAQRKLPRRGKRVCC
jgi:hypothetical protein